MSDSAVEHRTTTKLKLIFRCTLGLLVLLPAFIVWAQFAVLDNLARSEGAEGNWHAVLVPFASLLYIATLGIWVFIKKTSLIRDIYLIVYPSYIVAMFVWMIAGNVLNELHMYGPVIAFTDHIVEILFLTPAVAFLFDRMIILVTRRGEQSNLAFKRDALKRAP